MCLWVEKKNSVLPFLFLQMICFRKRKWKGWREWECNVPLTVSRVYISFSTSLIILFRFNEAIKMYEFIIYMKYFLFFSGHSSQQHQTLNEQEKKNRKKIWSNISRLSTNLVKKYCLRKLKENDERKTMKTNRKNLPLFTVSLRLIANANVQVHTYMLIFKNTFVQFFFFFVSGHFSFVFSHSHIFAVLKSISKQK